MADSSLRTSRRSGGPIAIIVYTDSVEAMRDGQGTIGSNEGVIVAAEINRRLLEHLLLRPANVLRTGTAAIPA